MKKTTLCRIVLLWVIALCAGISAESVGRFQVQGTQSDLNGTTVSVPQGTVAMSSSLLLQKYADEISSTGRPVAVFVIMDQTGSMMLYDPTGSRYDALRLVMAEVKKMTPRSEVGGVFFGADLGYNAREDKIFTKVGDNYNNTWSPGFLPLMRMDSLYQSDSNGTKNGYDHFTYYWAQKHVLTVEEEVGLNSSAISLFRSNPNHNMIWSFDHGPGKRENNMAFFGNTFSVDLALNAAKLAFTKTTIPKEDQYILFVSDGEGPVTDVVDVPTMFTIYYQGLYNADYSKLTAMTNAIKINGYSSSNPKSDIWAVKSAQEALDRVKQSVLSVITQTSSVVPTGVTVNGVVSTGGYDGTQIVLGSDVPLDVPFPYPYSQVITSNKTTTTIGDSGDTTYATTVVQDTVAYEVDTVSSLYDTSMVHMQWWDRAIGFSSHAAPLAAISSATDTLNLTFTQSPGTALHHYDSARVYVSTASGDAEVYTLNSSNAFSIALQHGTGAGNPGNGILEYSRNDVVKAVFRNAALPLDTHMVSIPVALNLPRASMMLNGQLQNNTLAEALGAARTFGGKQFPLQFSMVDSAGNVISAGVQIYYRLHNQPAVIGTNLYAGAASIDIGDTIRALAVIPGYDALVEGFWVYSRTYPVARIVALPSVAVPSAYAFTTSRQPVILKLLDSTDAEIPFSAEVSVRYTLNGNPSSGTAYAGGDTIWITGNDTLGAMADLTEYQKPADGTWYYRRNLKNAVLSADPGSAVHTSPYSYHTPSMGVKLQTSPHDTVYYSIASGGGTPTGPKLFFVDSAVVTIHGDDTIWAYADGVESNRVDTVWTYVSKLPLVRIVALPSIAAPDSFVFSTSKLPVQLKLLDSNSNEIPLSAGVALCYALKNGNPATGTVYRSGDTIWITGNDTLRATADLVEFAKPADGIWLYHQNLKKASLRANPGSAIRISPFPYATASLQVKLSTSAADTVYYAIASNGGTAAGPWQQFVDSGVVTVAGDDTVWAHADGLESDRVDTVWTYESTLPAAWLSATPSSDTVFRYGHTLTIALSSNADTIRWTKDGSAASAASARFVPGVDAIRLSDIDPDTVKIAGYAYGDNFASIRRNWVYVRDTLPALVADPSGGKFVGTLSVQVATSGTDASLWSTVRIFYTLDGTDPDTNSLLYTGAIEFDTTTVLKARMYAGNRIESPILTERYVLAVTSETAMYFDRLGDGSINGVSLHLSRAVSELPDSISLMSPFDINDKRIVKKADMVLEGNDGIRIDMKKPFAFDGETGFPAAALGRMFGAEYADSSLCVIGDSVAPVLMSAEYFFGRVTEVDPLIVRDRDTLVTAFSEPVSVAAVAEPFEFRRNGTLYHVSVLPGSDVTGRQMRFAVTAVLNVESPLPGDSVDISPLSCVSADGIWQNNPDNRRVSLVVHEQPFVLKIQAISPVNPDEYVIPAILKPLVYAGNTALVMVADFQAKIRYVDRIAVRAMIYDPLGNIVARNEGLGTGEDFVAELKEEPRTKVVFYWNGRNDGGRRVGSGSYSARIWITAADGSEMVKSVPIALQ